MKRVLLISSLCMIAISCSNIFDDAEYADDIRLGAKIKEVECLSEYGECSFDIVSNSTYSARIIKGSEWLCFTDSNESERIFEGDSRISLSFTSNRGFRRRGVIVISSGQRHDTLTVKQEGVYQPIVESDTDALMVPGEGGQYNLSIRTNLVKKDFLFETVDARGLPVIGKVGEYVFNDNILSFRVFPSESRDVKNFIARIYALDEWGEKIKADINITQSPGKK